MLCTVVHTWMGTWYVRSEPREPLKAGLPGFWMGRPMERLVGAPSLTTGSDNVRHRTASRPRVVTRSRERCAACSFLAAASKGTTSLQSRPFVSDRALPLASCFPSRCTRNRGRCMPYYAQMATNNTVCLSRSNITPGDQVSVLHDLTKGKTCMRFYAYVLYFSQGHRDMERNQLRYNYFTHKGTVTTKSRTSRANLMFSFFEVTQEMNERNVDMLSA